MCWITTVGVPVYTREMIAFCLIPSNAKVRAVSTSQQTLLPAGITTHQMHAVLYIVPATLPFLQEAEVSGIIL